MYIRLSVIAVAVFTALGLAQSGSMEHSKSSMTGGGHIVVHGETMGTPSSLLDLIRGATLIVDGSIARVLPSSMAGSEQAAAPIIETDSVVAINSIVSGKAQNNAVNIVIAQVGGKVGQWEAEDDRDPLVAAGERYILFLTPDNRTSPANTTGLPRYDVTGVWAGKIKVSDGAVQFARPSAATLHSFDGTDVNTFLGTVRATIKRPYTDADMNLPINLAPVK